MALSLPLAYTLSLWLWLFATPLALGAKIYLCGDSTMAKGREPTEGWGQYLQKYVTVPVVNKAAGGRSARSYTVEGKFKEVASLLQSGDTVVIEFGHNDGGSLKNDNGRTDCPGTGSETCQSVFKGEKVVVKTFPAYLTDAGKLMVGKGANVVFSSMTPNNIWEKGKADYTPSRFTTLARDAAKAVGKGATFVDHGSFVAKEFKAMGAAKVNAFFPKDHTHTNSAGAAVVAKTFVDAAKAANDPITRYLKEKGTASG